MVNCGMQIHVLLFEVISLIKSFLFLFHMQDILHGRKKKVWEKSNNEISILILAE